MVKIGWGEIWTYHRSVPRGNLTLKCIEDLIFSRKPMLILTKSAYQMRLMGIVMAGRYGIKHVVTMVPPSYIDAHQPPLICMSVIWMSL
jgi:hypothetical protein